jgi:uncharacterized protein YuzE
MIPFIHLSIDTEVPGGAGYVRYSHGIAVRQDAIDEDLTVCVDLDRDGNVVGIELTSLDDHAFALVTKAATKYGLKAPVLDDVYA